MELKICPDGQNKGFGQKSGKQKEGKKEKKGKEGGSGGRKTEITGGDIRRERKEQATWWG